MVAAKRAEKRAQDARAAEAALELRRAEAKAEAAQQDARRLEREVANLRNARRAERAEGDGASLRQERDAARAEVKRLQEQLAEQGRREAESRTRERKRQDARSSWDVLRASRESWRPGTAESKPSAPEAPSAGGERSANLEEELAARDTALAAAQRKS